MCCWSAIGARWKYLAIFFLALIVGHCGLEMRTRVDILSSKYLDDHTLVTCSVSSAGAEDLRLHNVYLHCPVLGDGKICYINCNNLLLNSRGEAIHTTVFHSCQNTWNLENRIEFQYLLNNRYIEVIGDWHCAYKNDRSMKMTIEKYKPPHVIRTMTTTTTVGPKQESSSAMTVTCSQPMQCPVQSSHASVIAGTICAFCVSAICNILLAILFCISRCESRRIKRHQLSKDSDQCPTERFSLLSKNSKRPRELTQFLSSRTPSLDTPSNKESFSTYMQDTVHSGSCKATSIHMHPDHRYRIIEIIPSPPLSHEYLGMLPPPSNDEINSIAEMFVPAVQMRPFEAQRQSEQFSRASYSIHDSSPPPALPPSGPMLAARTCSSHQQLHHHYTDDPSPGSALLCRGHEPSSFRGRSDKVDLIHDCSLTDMPNRTSIDT